MTSAEPDADADARHMKTCRQLFDEQLEPQDLEHVSARRTCYEGSVRSQAGFLLSKRDCRDECSPYDAA